MQRVNDNDNLSSPSRGLVVWGVRGGVASPEYSVGLGVGRGVLRGAAGCSGSCSLLTEGLRIDELSSTGLFMKAKCHPFVTHT